MARPAEVFVLWLRNEERTFLRTLRRRGKQFAAAVTCRGAQAVDSNRGYSAPEIAGRWRGRVRALDR